MLLTRFVVWMFAVGTMILGAGMVSAQNYPNKPIRIVTAGVGGSADFAARLIAQGISGPLGVQVLIDNRPSGVIPGDVVARASPDGYTLLLTSATLWTAGFLLENVPYDPVRDFLPISLVVTSPAILVVHPSLPVKSVKELIALAKAKPEALNYASTGLGGSSHLAAELFKAMARVDIARINYKSGATQLADLISGQVQLSFGSASSVAPYVKSGRLRALAVTSAQPSSLVPGLPTVAASGLPGYEALNILGMFAPAKTPATIINRLNQEVVRALNMADVKEKFFNTGVEIVGSSPEEFATLIKSDMATMGKMIKDLGLRAQ